MTAKLDNGKPLINVKIEATAVMRKYLTDGGSEYLTPEVLSSLEKQLAESIRSEIDSAIEKGQKELKSDIFGFGNTLQKVSGSLAQGI